MEWNSPHEWHHMLHDVFAKGDDNKEFLWEEKAALVLGNQQTTGKRKVRAKYSRRPADIRSSTNSCSRLILLYNQLEKILENICNSYVFPLVLKLISHEAAWHTSLLDTIRQDMTRDAPPVQKTNLETHNHPRRPHCLLNFPFISSFYRCPQCEGLTDGQTWTRSSNDVFTIRCKRATYGEQRYTCQKVAGGDEADLFKDTHHPTVTIFKTKVMRMWPLWSWAFCLKGCKWGLGFFPASHPLLPDH